MKKIKARITDGNPYLIAKHLCFSIDGFSMNFETYEEYLNVLFLYDKDNNLVGAVNLNKYDVKYEV